jgi:predicted CoA-binding protein
MTHQNPSDAELYRILDQARTVAIVGASARPERASHEIMKQLMRRGYEVIPVNPNETEVLGRKTVASLRGIPVPVDIVDVFRRSDQTPEIAVQAVAIGAKTLWLQQGVINEEAALRASQGGLAVVMDLCIGVIHAVLQVPDKAHPVGP